MPNGPGRRVCRLRSRDPARSRAPVRLVSFVALILLVGCDRNIEPYQPGEEPRPPDLGRIFPGPTGAPAEGGADAAQGASRQAARTALPPTRTGAAPPAVPPSGAGGAGAAIEGEIELSDALRPPDGGVLFVIARTQGARGGPPLAVLRIPEPEFPVAFRIGPENVMIPSLTFAGSISLSARLDADGNAMTRGAADVSSGVVEPLEPGTTGVRLVLSERGG